MLLLDLESFNAKPHSKTDWCFEFMSVVELQGSIACQENKPVAELTAKPASPLS